MLIKAARLGALAAFAMALFIAAAQSLASKFIGSSQGWSAYSAGSGDAAMLGPRATVARSSSA